MASSAVGHGLRTDDDQHDRPSEAEAQAAAERDSTVENRTADIDIDTIDGSHAVRSESWSKCQTDRTVHNQRVPFTFANLLLYASQRPGTVSFPLPRLSVFPRRLVTADLEDNGLPAQPSSPAASSSGFAEDFYRSGTDWSSLRAPPPPGGPPGVKEKERGGGSLVQSSLFQAWGIEKPWREVGDSSLVQRSLFQRGGSRGRGARGSGLGAADSSRGTEEEGVTAKKPLACPFYKKIPALIHFRLSDGKTYLHAGDFIVSKSMQLHPLLQRGRVNLVYLDTTYCHPKYTFPPQEDVIDFVVRTARRYLKKQPKTLIVVGAYSIGKENVYLAISQALEVPIYTDASRRRILHSFGWSDLSKRICSCNQSSPLHVLPLGSVNHENLKKYLETLNGRFLAVLAFWPTGWTFSEATRKHLDLIKPSSNGSVTIYGVPYSKHSSFTELRDFVMFLRPQKVIPTVIVGNATSRDKMQAHFREWLKSL
ncbi:unnamed protein product [Miscanthus lutarioriparius]|uniref:DNA repair metallo-beta-lactamase domain-containing protein n=1 Tax=Miscanthus lutarioriparius TaxID=422564 RepID=A0A811QYU4_9POAL|nr:unnamed protein product [Miscanthus lutarioriparius]